MRARIAVGAVSGLALLTLPALAAVSRGGGTVGDPVLSSSVPVFATAPQAHASAAPRTSAAAGGRVDVSAEWARSAAARAGVPETAVRAYGRAELLLAQSDPGCDLAWTTLAGIGYVESHHGTIGDRSLGPDGRSSTPILGPALNGVGDVAAIPSTSLSATWHGDRQWDHAVGPLQFIPSTWARWSSDGDGDGVGDPNDLDDAAFAAGRYLCADSQALGTGSGWSRAIFSYNHSTEYIESVYAAASAYAERTR